MSDHPLDDAKEALKVADLRHSPEEAALQLQKAQAQALIAIAEALEDLVAEYLDRG